MAGVDAGRAARPGRRDGAGLPLAVDLRGVRKSFGPVRAVRGVALAVGAGEVVAFLGPNGAGKTSTIDMILGLSRPDAGAVQVYGMAPRLAVRKGLVAAVMQTGGLLKDLTVAEIQARDRHPGRKGGSQPGCGQPPPRSRSRSRTGWS